jgi:hypothetical protein
MILAAILGLVAHRTWCIGFGALEQPAGSSIPRLAWQAAAASQGYRMWQMMLLDDN